MPNCTETCPFFRETVTVVTVPYYDIGMEHGDRDSGDMYERHSCFCDLIRRSVNKGLNCKKLLLKVADYHIL